MGGIESGLQHPVQALRADGQHPLAVAPFEFDTAPAEMPVGFSLRPEAYGRRPDFACYLPSGDSNSLTLPPIGGTNANQVDQQAAALLQNVHMSLLGVGAATTSGDGPNSCRWGKCRDDLRIQTGPYGCRGGQCTGHSD